MRTAILRILSASWVLGLLLTAHAQVDQSPADNVPTAESVGSVATNEVATQDQDGTTATAAKPSESTVENVTTTAATLEPPPGNLPAGTKGEQELHLNFRGAPIEMILSYLSDAAGFIIQLDTPVRGKVDVWSSQPVTKDEAVDLLNSVLNKNGYAAIRNGRKLTIVSKDDAIHGDIPVKTGNDPAAIPKNDEIVTQIIPIRFVEAEQLVKDLSPMVSSHATIVANEAGNSIAVTDTQANIHHLVEIIKAIDMSAEDATELRVFHLKHHDPVEVANLLTGLFSDQSSSGGNQNPIRFGFPGVFGGAGGFRGGGFGGGGFGNAGGGGGNRPGVAGAAGGANNQADRIKKRQQVVAVADPRTSSVVVTAAKDLIEQIAGMIQQLDQDSPKVAHVSVIHLENADPQQVQQVLQDMFQSSTASRNTANQNSPLMNRIQQQNQGTTTTGSGIGNSGLGTSRSGLGGTSF